MCLGLSLVFGVVFMLLVRFLAGLMVWLFIIGVFVGFAAITGFCFYNYHNFDKIQAELKGDSSKAKVSSSEALA